MWRSTRFARREPCGVRRDLAQEIARSPSARPDARRGARPDREGQRLARLQGGLRREKTVDLLLANAHRDALGDRMIPRLPATPARACAMCRADRPRERAYDIYPAC